MAKFLIEVPHDGTTAACIDAIAVFLRTGSHFLTHADWGCKDGDHRAWIVLEVDSKEEARNVIPSVFQERAKITQLNAFTMQELEQLLEQHRA